MFRLGQILFRAPLFKTTQLHHVLMKCEYWHLFMTQNMALQAGDKMLLDHG